MEYDEQSLNSAPTMGPDGVRILRFDDDEPSLGSAPTMVGSLNGGASSQSEPHGKGDSHGGLAPPSGAHQPGELMTVRVGSQTVNLRWCPPGTFDMGSPSSEKDRDSWERQPRVTLTRGFWMGETEVTVARGDGQQPFKQVRRQLPG